LANRFEKTAVLPRLAVTESPKVTIVGGSAANKLTFCARKPMIATNKSGRVINRWAGFSLPGLKPLHPVFLLPLATWDRDSKQEDFEEGFADIQKIIANRDFRKHSLLVIFYYQMGISKFLMIAIDLPMGGGKRDHGGISLAAFPPSRLLSKLPAKCLGAPYRCALLLLCRGADFHICRGSAHPSPDRYGNLSYLPPTTSSSLPSSPPGIRCRE